VKSKDDLLFSGCVDGAGGLFMILSLYVHPGMSEVPFVLEQLIGDKGVNDMFLCAGAGMLVGGTIASIACLGRITKIRLLIKKNYQSFGSLNISTSAILNNHTKSFCPEFRLTYNF
jgi:hypothetical protein